MDILNPVPARLCAYLCAQALCGLQPGFQLYVLCCCSSFYATLAPFSGRSANCSSAAQPLSVSRRLEDLNYKTGMRQSIHIL